MECSVCPRSCGIDRQKNSGYCRAKEEMIIGRVGVHCYEEPPISGTCGSGTIFFSGCNLRCVYCQNYALSKELCGKRFTPSELLVQIKKLEALGVHNINLVTPTHYVDKIIETLKLYHPAVPIVYNCSGYESVETLKRLEGYVDIYLPDFKYSDNLLGQKYSNVEDYREVAILAIGEMVRQKPNIFEGGIMKQGVIIRHLVLPECLENSKGVLRLIKEHLGIDVTMSVMSQFTPVAKCNYPELNRTLKPLEYKIVLNFAEKLGFHNVFVQESGAADKTYIPEFFDFENAEKVFL